MMAKNVTKKILITLLVLGALFYFLEFFLHVLGLPVLEHDKIFIPTHDRYIALFALTYGVLLILISTNLEKYKIVFYITVVGIFLSFLNGLWISFQGGYAPLFNVATLDQQLSIIGYLFILWYALLLGCWYYHGHMNGKINLGKINKLKS